MDRSLDAAAAAAAIHSFRAFQTNVFNPLEINLNVKLWSCSVCPVTPSFTNAATVCCAPSCVTMRQKLVSIDLVVFGNECNNENNYCAGEWYWFGLSLCPKASAL